MYVCVCVNFLMGREGRKQSDGHLSGERCGVPRAEGTDPQVQLAKEYRSRLGQEFALKVNNPA